MSDIPPCFGNKECWNPREPECAGGRDDSYTDAVGGHIRKQCTFFQACGSKVQEQVVVNPRLLPPARVTNPPYAAFGASGQEIAARMEAQRKEAARLEVEQGVSKMNETLLALGSRPITPTPVHVGATSHPLAMRTSDMFVMPPYLSAMEPIHADEPLWKPLSRELLRAGLKGMAHTLASFVDRVVFSRR